MEEIYFVNIVFDIGIIIGYFFVFIVFGYSLDKIIGCMYFMEIFML